MQLLLLLSLVASASAVVPQIPLCDFDGCPTVSQLGLGCLHLGDKIGGIFDAESVNAWVLNAVEQGITLFDTADVYPVIGGTGGDAARLLGAGLALTPGLRENITIVAKMDIIPPSSLDTSHEHLTSTVDWFLDALGTSYLDIILLHFPDSFMDPSQVASTFNDLKNDNKVLYFGTSNHYPSHRNALNSKLSQYDIQLVTNEIEVSVWNPSYLNYDQSLVDDGIINGYRNIAWGILGGNPLGGFNRLFIRKGLRQEKILHALKKVGKEIGEDDEAVVAVAWLFAHSANFIGLAGTTKIDRVNSLVRSFDLKDQFTPALWWEIAKAGGVCNLADVQCNYEKYNAYHLPKLLPHLMDIFKHNHTMEGEDEERDNYYE